MVSLERASWEGFGLAGSKLKDSFYAFAVYISLSI